MMTGTDFLLTALGVVLGIVVPIIAMGVLAGWLGKKP